MTKYKISDEMLTNAVRDSVSFSDALRGLNLAVQGGSFTHYRKRAVALGLDFSHFSVRGGPGCITPKKGASEVLVLRESGARQGGKNLRSALIEIGRPYCCEKCGQLPEWMGNPLTLDVDHINENWLDDRAENLRFLCPNCHSQFSRGLLKPKHKTKWKPTAPTESKPCLTCGAQVKDKANSYCSHKCGHAS
ncbi:HNH endonuclease signature motif containing protein, partial [Janthinobacterium sp.]|uniref:HNH endonuclease signature motif containing protein n=1 Tax=Janthinobacterium sp. TaxID=1871054 RepID=UPI00260C6C46